MERERKIFCGVDAVNPQVFTLETLFKITKMYVMIYMDSASVLTSRPRLGDQRGD